MVEHWLPKPRVAGSNPVFRSKQRKKGQQMTGFFIAGPAGRKELNFRMLTNFGRNRQLVKGLRLSIALLLGLAILLSLGGCDSLEEGVKKAQAFIPENYELVHIEQVSEDSGIVFYTYDEELSAGIFTKSKFGWDWVGNGIGKLVEFPEGLQWRYADLAVNDKIKYSVYYGKVVNKDITRITVTTTNGETVEGKIVDADDLKLWYSFISEPQIPSVNASIVGYNEDGEVVYLFCQPN